MMVAWAANELPSYTTINKSVSNDGLMMVFSIIIVAGILLPICAIIFGSTVRRLLNQSNVDMDLSSTSGPSRNLP